MIVWCAPEPTDEENEGYALWHTHQQRTWGLKFEGTFSFDTQWWIERYCLEQDQAAVS